MDTAFINRVGLTRGWQYQDAQFLSRRIRVSRGSSASTRSSGSSGAERSRCRAGREAFYLPASASTSRAPGILRVDYGTGHETFAGQRVRRSGRVMVDGGVQIHALAEHRRRRRRKARRSSTTQEAPFQGDRRIGELRVGLQPNARLNSNTSYSFVTFDEPRHGRAASTRARREPAEHVSVHARDSSCGRSRSSTRHASACSPIFSRPTSCHREPSCMRVTDRCSDGRTRIWSSTDIRATARAFFFKASYRAHF